MNLFVVLDGEDLVWVESAERVEGALREAHQLNELRRALPRQIPRLLATETVFRVQTTLLTTHVPALSAYAYSHTLILFVALWVTLFLHWV